MKMKIITCIIASLISSGAMAQYMGTVPPNADVRFMYSQDTDDFRADTGWIGAAHESGIGARVGASRYSGKQSLGSSVVWDGDGNKTPGTITNKFSVNSEFVQLTYVDLGEDHSFHGAFGVRTVGTISNHLDMQFTDPTINTSVNGGNGPSQHIIADAELKLVMTDSLTLGITAATDVVESVRSLQTGTTYVYVAGDMDLLLDENLNLNVIAGDVHYSDNNDRLFIKTKLTWTFIPEYGLSTYLRTKSQTDTNPQSTTTITGETDSPTGGYWYGFNRPVNYYSPQYLNQAAVGLQLRVPHSGLVYTAGVDFGHEWATLKDGTSTDNPVYSWQLGIQTSPGRKTGTTYGVSVTGSNSSIRGSGGDYNWYGLNSWMKVPF